MKKGKVARLAGFAGALGLTTVLVTTAVQGTGAYFTSSVDGNLKATSGHLTVTASSTNLNFTNLVPGVDQHQSVTFGVTAGSATAADIWLVFDPNSAEYAAFTGAKAANGGYVSNAFDGGLGQYGHFAVVGQQGHRFDSYNLQLPKASDAMAAYSYTSSGVNVCNVDANGNGGSNIQHTYGHGNDIAECGVPAAILLRTGLQPGDSGSATIYFGVTGKSSAQDTLAVDVPFKIVATQPGQYPLIKADSDAGQKNPSSIGTIGTNW